MADKVDLDALQKVLAATKEKMKKAAKAAKELKGDVDDAKKRTKAIDKL